MSGAFRGLLIGAALMAAAALPVGWAAADDAQTCEKTSGEGAIAACSRAIASGGYQGRGLAVLHNNRGIAYRKTGDLDRAMADYAEAIRIDAAYANAYYNRGIAWRQKGDHERAIADYSEAIKLNPRDGDIWNNRCFARVIVGRDLQQALADCNESLRLAPNNAGNLDTRGLAYLRLGQLDSAIADYDAVLKQYPKIPDSLYGRGMAKRKKGDTAGGDADIAAAKAIKADIADVFARYGVK